MNSNKLEINLNRQLTELLEYYGVKTRIEDGFVHTDLPDSAKFRAKTVYEGEKPVSSLLCINCVTAIGEDIYELCRDSGESIEQAVAQNFENIASTINPLLAALGSLNPYSYENTTIEEWRINGKLWEVYIGAPYHKFSQRVKGYAIITESDKSEFIDAMKAVILKQELKNRLHWFRGYYCQTHGEITIQEFLMDNHPIEGLSNFFDGIPIQPIKDFFSCRIFVVLKEKSE